MRGDRPVFVDSGQYGVEATPHARGSTWRITHLPSGRAGYPACAGIDLARAIIVGPQARLPRMRGDRPLGESLEALIHAATPHARGSTRAASDNPSFAYGYPACAGIDPCRIGQSIIRLRLPRMRGDRPMLHPCPSLR